MKNKFFYRLSKIPIYMKYIFPNESKVIKNLYNNNLSSKKTKANSDDYFYEKLPKYDYFPVHTYCNIKGIMSHSYKNYGYSKEKKTSMNNKKVDDLEYNLEAKKFLFGDK